MFPRHQQRWRRQIVSAGTHSASHIALMQQVILNDFHKNVSSAFLGKCDPFSEFSLCLLYQPFLSCISSIKANGTARVVFSLCAFAKIWLGSAASMMSTSKKFPDTQPCRAILLFLLTSTWNAKRVNKLDFEAKFYNFIGFELFPAFYSFAAFFPWVKRKHYFNLWNRKH